MAWWGLAKRQVVSRCGKQYCAVPRGVATVSSLKRLQCFCERQAFMRLCYSPFDLLSLIRLGRQMQRPEPASGDVVRDPLVIGELVVVCRLDLFDTPMRRPANLAGAFLRRMRRDLLVGKSAQSFGPIADEHDA